MTKNTKEERPTDGQRQPSRPSRDTAPTLSPDDQAIIDRVLREGDRLLQRLARR